MEKIGTRYGIARCSTTKQDVEYEITELMKKGVKKENIFIEYISGKTELSKRVELDKLLKIVKPGDTIVATDITRIARNPKVFYEILDFVENNKLCLEVGTLKADCRTDKLDIMTSTMLQILSVFASFDVKMKSFQVKLGLANAVANNKKLGRPKLTKDDIPDNFYKNLDLYNKGSINKTEFARIMNWSRPKLNRIMELNK